MQVDLVLLTRDDPPPRDDVVRGIRAQAGIALTVHRVIGWPDRSDPHRWATIARARNEARRRGVHPYVFFLDDDVVLEPHCIAQLLASLSRRNDFAALAADYNGECRTPWVSPDYPPHVGMGAVLFRRSCLDRIRFRWEANRCECQCCCDDLRRLGLAIGYLPEARALHRRAPSRPAERTHCASPPGRPTLNGPPRPGRILAAFNRSHLRRFRDQFLSTLRASGNTEIVTAVTYGLRPHERAALAALPGVEVAAIQKQGMSPAARRIYDFPRVISSWTDDTPVAYWDAGDIVFQDRIAPLWDLVRANPTKLHVTREPIPFVATPAVENWVSSIHDPRSRAYFLDLFSRRPIFNGGFAAGTVAALRHYFNQAVRIRESDALRGSTDWGDQTAMNAYCHTRPDRVVEVSQGWNFCLFGRSIRRPFGRRIESVDGTPVHVVHGNGSSLGLLALDYQFT